MTQHTALSPQDHRDLRIRTDRSAALGDDVMAALVVPQEFRSLQNLYPIVFQRSADRTRFQALALLGFENGENLYLTDDGWDAPILPASLDIQPFLVGLNKDGSGEPKVHVDMDSDRISVDGIGERVFDDTGRATDYLEGVSGRLALLHDGMKSLDDFVAALESHGLLEPFTLDVPLKDGSKHRLVGFHTINEDKLAALDAATVGTLHEAGWLMPAFMVVASLSNLAPLIARKNASLALIA